MDALWHLNLIRFFDFYLAWMFFASVYRRFRQYQTIGQLAFAGPGRWPRLLQLIRQHRTIFLTWKTAAPALLALVLWLLQLAASRLMFPEAGAPPHGLELHKLFEDWPVLIYLVPLAAAMVAFDLWGIVVVGEISRADMEKYFDQAEFWLSSPAAHVVKVATFGFVNPRRMVREEVQKALVAASGMVNYNLWWISTQTGLRIAFGLAMWLTWAFL
jgi:hypothetical protein